LHDHSTIRIKVTPDSSVIEQYLQSEGVDVAALINTVLRELIEMTEACFTVAIN
jgi:hypothetical protein